MLRLAALTPPALDPGASVCAPTTIAPFPHPLEAVPVEGLHRVENANGRVALTFDACPATERGGFDLRIFQTLQEMKVPSTLFISGRWAQTHPDEVRTLAKEPLFEIGNHSHLHPLMPAMSPIRQREELLWTQAVLFSLTGKVPRYFRPPFGMCDDKVADTAAKLGLVTVQYDVPAGDSDGTVPKERLLSWLLEKIRPGSIVVLHMNGNGVHTADILPDLIDGLRKKGMAPTTVGELHQKAKEMAGR
jgi:peptidoglycan/xylan/chitin deacetylase (PgdA/CDA1 family)